MKSYTIAEIILGSTFFMKLSLVDEIAPTDKVISDTYIIHIDEVALESTNQWSHIRLNASYW